MEQASAEKDLKELSNFVKEVAEENDCSIQEVSHWLKGVYLLYIKSRLLTKREADIAILAARGASIKETAQELYIAPSTVQSYRKRIREKLGIAPGVRLNDHLPKSFYQDR